jgi:hypothetical protein
MGVLAPPLFGLAQARPGKDDLYTPAWLFERLGLRFDLDPCAPPGGVPWVPAARYFTRADDGLAQPWEGRVWMNPPYSNTTPWVLRFMAHGHGVALVQHAKSRWHRLLWEGAEAVVFPRRFDFAGSPFGGHGEVRMPVWLAAYGPECTEALGRLGVVRVVR